MAHLRNPNMLCGDCEHMDENGACSQMVEALVMAGYPRSLSFPVDTMDTSAESCPDFEQTEASRRSPAVEGWGMDNGERVLRVNKGFSL